MNRKLVSSTLIVISLLILLPGVMLPMLQMSIKCDIHTQLGQFSVDALDKSYSILETVKDLWKRDKPLVSFLILMFSVLVPIGKGILFLLMLRFKEKQYQIYRFLSGWSKWSMADVFVVAILLAYLASGNETQSQINEINLLGMKMKFKIDLLFSSKLLPGFYYFLSYCLISIVAITIYQNPLVIENDA